MKSYSRIIHIIIFGIVNSFISVSLGFGQITDTVKIRQVFIESDTAYGQTLDTINSSFDKNEVGFNKESSTELSDGEGNVPSFWTSYIFNPMRLALKYEVAYKVTKPDEIKNNRFSFRLEYSKFFFNKVTLQLDTKISTFLKDDHRTRMSTFWINDYPKNAEMSFEGRTREVYLQTSFHETSIKVGIQSLAWGESDFATVTDEISPMDYREPLTLNIDELKIGQPMFTVDQYSPFGDWSGFFIPYPGFNKHPKKGDGYYYDPFNGSIEYRKEKQGKIFFEYGVRWKKTFGKSDISIMAASLINNEYALRMVTPSLITQSKLRYSMAGMTFNYAISNLLVRGEVAIKYPKPYNDASFQIVKKKALDASLALDYSPYSTFSLTMEAVNYHVVDWNNEIQGMPEDNYIILLVLSKLFMNNDLSVNWITMYNGPNTSFFNMLSTSYNWNDHFSLFFDILIPSADNVNSGLYIYRDQKQASFKIQYQF